MSYLDELEKVHEEVIAEEGINPANLPIDIKKKIRGWEIVLKRLQANPEDKKSFETLQIQSLQIADSIQNYLEEDFEDEDEDGDGDGDGKESKDDNKEPKSDGKEPKSDGKDPKVNQEPKAPTSSQNRDKRFGNLVMEKKILAITNANGGRISINQLEQIIGCEPDYPEQQVHNIRLRKVFMASYYKVK